MNDGCFSPIINSVLNVLTANFEVKLRLYVSTIYFFLIKENFWLVNGKENKNKNAV